MKLVPRIVAGSRFAGRAALGFGLVTLISAVTAIGTGLFARSEATKREKILEAYADDLAQGFRAQLAAEKMVAIGRGYLLVSEPELLDRLNETEGELGQALHALDRPNASDEERRLLHEVRESAAQYQAIFDEILTATSADARASRVWLLREQLIPRRRDLGAHLEQLVEHKRQVQLAARGVARQMAARTFALVVSASIIAVAFSILLAWRFIRQLGSIYRREQEVADAAERASAAREELLGVVAHDLRNPLSAIALKAVSIERHADDPRNRERAESIRRLAARMQELIGSLLEAASIEAGRLSLSWKHCTVSELFAAAAEMFGGLARAKGVALEEEEPSRELVFRADPERIYQVVSNIVGNALKFTPAGGTVRLRALDSGCRIRFEVRDTGPGIAPEDIPRVFDRFWRAERDGRKSTGLGLYIAKGIIDAHGGRIWVESQMGDGCAFVFEIPAAPPAADPTRSAPLEIHLAADTAGGGPAAAAGKPAG